MEESSSLSPPSPPSLSPRGKRRLTSPSTSPGSQLRQRGRGGRRISEQQQRSVMTTTLVDVVDTIMEEPDEEEKKNKKLNHAITKFYSNRSENIASTGGGGSSNEMIQGASPVPTRAALPRQLWRTDRQVWIVSSEKGESDQAEDDGQEDINPRSLLDQNGMVRTSMVSLPDARNNDRDSFCRAGYGHEATSSKSLAWSQFKAMLSKNFKLYHSVDVYLLAILIVIGMLIIPYHYSFVTEAKATSYHSWHLDFPGSFGFLKSQSAHFWIKLLTGNDKLTESAAEEVVNASFGLDYADLLFGHDENHDGDGHDDERTMAFLYPKKTKADEKAKRRFQTLEKDIMQMGRRLLRHPVPTPSLNQYIMIRNVLGLAKDHFNQTNTPLGTLHIAPPFPDFEDYLRELFDDPARTCYDTRYDGCDLLIRNHETSSEALDFILAGIEPTWALLDFTDWDEEYAIRMDPAELPSTPIGENAVATSDEYQLYFTSGFLTLQKTIDEYAFVVADRTADDNCYRKALRQTMVTMPMPTRAFVQNTYLSTYGFLIGLACIATLLAPIARLVLALVSEKEAKLQSMIMVAGVPGWLINVSWLSFALILFLVVSFLVSVLLKLSLLSHIPFWKLTIWMAFSGISAASFAFAFGIVFEQTKLSAALAPALFLATALPRFIVFGIQEDANMFHHWVAMFPGSAICLGVDSLLGEHGEATSGEMIRLWRVVAFLLLDSMAALTFGFLCSSVDVEAEIERCMKSIGVSNISDDGSVASHTSASTPVSVQTQRSFHQSFPSESKFPMIYLQGLVKHFQRSRHPVINGIDFMFNQGEIAALIGHNGAGKSTLAWVMAGLMKPTNGDCLIRGLSLYATSTQKHVGVGFCPQANILYCNLTVKYHLEFFAKLHGVVHDTKAVERRARAVGLQENLHAFVHTLSQGNKRKLSFAIARYGRRFGALILDEPMAGQDLDSRKICWKCMQQDKESCAVVIVTHNVKEAEQRADRVVVVKDGAFHASGSPRFLKQRFQLPCTLSVGLNRSKRELFEKKGSKFVLSFHGLDAKLIYAVGNTYRYHIPQESLHIIPTMLDSLDRFVRENFIASIKVETGSLSELCCMISEDVDDFSTSSTAASTECDDRNPIYEAHTKFMDESGRVDVSWITHVNLMCWKRWQIRKRRVFGLVRHMLIFTALVALSLGILAVPIRRHNFSFGLSPSHLTTGEGSSLYVGGGSTLTNPYTSERVMIDKLKAVEEAMVHDDTTINVTRFPSVLNSSAMSSHLDSQLNDDTLGAFVLFDVIHFRWDVDWPFYRKYLLRLQEAYQTTVGNWSFSLDALGYETRLNNSTGGSVEINPGVETVALLDWFVRLAKEEIDRNVEYQLQRDRQRQHGTAGILMSASVMHNASFPHAVVMLQKAYYDSMYYECSFRKHLVKAKSFPFPSPSSKERRARTVQSILASLFLLIPLSSIAGTLTAFHTEERARKTSFMQLKTGVPLSAFWVANFLSDLLPMGLVPFIVMGVMACYTDDASMFVFGGVEQALCTFALLSGFSLAVIPFSYLASRPFRCPFAAQFVVTVVLFVAGLVPLTMIYTIEAISETDSVRFGSLIWLFRACPSFALGEGLIELCKYQSYLQEHGSPFAAAVSGDALKALVGSIVPFFACFLFLEHYGGWLSVRRAREWVASGSISSTSGRGCDTNRKLRQCAVVEVESATKVYVRSIASVLTDEVVFLWQHAKHFCRLFLYSLMARDLPEIQGVEKINAPKVALDVISLTLEKGETLGVVGASGNGKSTLLELLSGSITPSRGYVRIFSDPCQPAMKSAPLDARIGYCPQTDPFWDDLTGRETLVLYGRISGVPENCVNNRASKILGCIDLEQQADTVTKLYCGGNRRKLALGISLIGDPEILLIDECCSGIDPLSSLKMWKSISDASTEAAVILATHNFQEAEALCTEIASISSGRVRFGGTATKPDFLVEIHLSAPTLQCNEAQAVRRAIDYDFPGNVFLEDSPSLISFYWHTLEHRSAGDVIRRLQSKLLSFHCVEGFRVSQGGIEVANIPAVDAVQILFKKLVADGHRDRFEI